MAAADKLQNWDVQLAQYILSRLTMPAQWGVNDCAMFACGGIEAQYGVDVVSDIRGTYSTEEQALEVIREKTGGGTFLDLVDLIAKRWAVPRINTREARRGDLVQFIGLQGPTLGLVDMDGRSVLAPGLERLASVPLRGIQGRAWRLD